MERAKEDALHNDLLKRLPRQEFNLVQPHLRCVALKTREELNGIGSPIRYLHFPVTAAISLMDMQSSGRTVEIAVVGKEGCACSHVLDGVHLSPSRTIVQVAGVTFRLAVSSLPRLLPQVPFFTRMARRFNGVLFRQAVISVGCSQHHSVEQRLSRWLLAHRNRTGQSTFAFTHDFLAEQLGVLRSTVTDTLATFERMGIIEAGYGRVELGNVGQMEKLSCECFPLAKQAIEDYLSDIESYAREA
jgi:hypothetical protein